MFQKAPEFHTEKRLNVFLKENGGYYPYIAVRGFVKALSPAIRSIQNPHISGVIQKHSIKEHVVSRSSSGFWFVPSQSFLAGDESSDLFHIMKEPDNIWVLL